MTIIRIGSTKKYADNWSDAFGGKPAKKAATPAAKAAPKKVASKPVKASKPATAKKAAPKAAK